MMETMKDDDNHDDIDHHDVMINILMMKCLFV